MLSVRKSERFLIYKMTDAAEQPVPLEDIPQENTDASNNQQNAQSIQPEKAENPTNQANEADGEQEQPEQHENVIWHAIKWLGWGIYKVAYHSGEFLADLFGITTPRYQYALTEYYERERQKALREKMEAGEIDENGNPLPPKEGTA